MSPTVRLFQLLRAYEELTRLETFALRENNLAYLNRLQARKRPLAARLAPMRKAAGLSESESKRVDELLHALESEEQRNLETLGMAMRTVSESLAGLGRSSRRCGRMRRTYRQEMPATAAALVQRA